MSGPGSEIGIADLAGRQGQELGPTGWLTIDQDRINAFAHATGDSQWIHVDEARAANGPFGGTIAHGYLTLSLVSSFLDDLLHVDDAGTSINYGLDRVRFPAPVRVGSRVRALGLLIGVDDVPNGVQTITRITLSSDVETKPVCVAEVLTRFLRH
jgi:acyl dehydratase